MEKIVWGLVFILFDFTLFNIPILPDFIGCILIYLGTERFLRNAYHFKQVRPFVLALGLYDFVVVIQDILNLSIGLGIIGSLLDLVFSAITIYSVYTLILGIYDLEAHYRMNLQSSQLQKLFQAYMILYVVMIIVAYIPILNIVVLPLILVNFVLKVIFVATFYKTSVAYRNHFLN